MALFTVTTTLGAPTEVYGGLAACDAYIDGMIGAAAIAYRLLASNSDDRKRLLIAATRQIDRQRWRGTPNKLGGTTLAFPRDGLVGFSNAEQLALVQRATFELAATLALESSTPGDRRNVKSEATKSIQVEYFEVVGDDGLPQAVDDLVGAWLASDTIPAASSAGAAESTGLRGDSIFDKCGELKRRGPF